MPSEEARATRVGVLDKAMAILEAFPRGESALLPQEIAERTGLPLPTVYRLAQALAEHGLLMKEGSRFRLGLTLLRLGLLVAESIDVRRQALPHLTWLNGQTGENAELHIRQHETRVVIEVVRSPHNLRPFAEIGAPLPLHRGAAGKVLLAWLSGEERLALARASRERFDSEQVAGERDWDEGSFVAELERVRRQGWAYSEGERVAGVAGLAAPIFDSRGRIAAALTLVAPAARLGPEQRERAIPLVCEAARRASYDMGHIASAASLTGAAGSERQEQRHQRHNGVGAEPPMP
ncbi:MAG: IclR family transcriptional regulator [Thermogemmatispora sp.]|uniref:IclR family transcriptional regulator n=1 Tax=Thermogemmatispora sp. TaxID=1968838 RepID=UPI0019DF5CC4|nr:IclR family transcriptional regulator [Thermogemmatispora sp.]MBE3565625.1 IclR family transcriptional regulator [Thermogemmatispora sp.]